MPMAAMTPSAMPETFDGATIRLYGTDLLVVLVSSWVLADPYESQLLVVAFRFRFQRTVVLAAQDPRGIPTYYGPAAIVGALRLLPFDALSWRRYIFRRKVAPKLPIPVEDGPWNYTDSQPSWSFCPPAAPCDEPALPVPRSDARRERGHALTTRRLPDPEPSDLE